MFKPVFFLLIGLLFIFVVNAQNLEARADDDNLLKSFTATCQDPETTCTYSFVLSNTNSTGSIEAQVIVLINSQEVFNNTYTVDGLTSQTANFEIKHDSMVALYILPNEKYTYMLLSVYDKADGQGRLVIDSKQLRFLVPNSCTEQGCGFTFQRSKPWSPNVTAEFKVNGVTVATLDESTSNAEIPFNRGDILSIHILGKPEDIADEFFVDVNSGGEVYFEWYANSYFRPMYFPAFCYPPIPSPFGGRLRPLTQEQIDVFLSSIGTSYSTLWYRETENQNN